MTELPEGWAWTTLGEVSVKPQYGWTTKARVDGPGVRLLRTTDITPGVIDWSRVPYCTTEPDEPDRFLLATNDIVVSRAGSVGASIRVIAPPPAVFASYLIRLRALGEVDPRYVAWFLRSPRYWRQIEEAAAGIALLNVNAKKLAAIRIPLAPAAEQRRIVAAIEEQFSCLDAAADSMLRAERRVTQLREALLASAVDGPWPVEPLSSVLVSLRNGMFVSRPAAQPPGTAIFRISAVRPLSLDIEDVRYGPVKANDCAGYLVTEGDLLFTRYSGNPEYVGACARVPRLPRPTLHPDKLIRAVINRDKAEPAFIELACATGVTREQIRARRKTTAGQVGIAGGQLKSVPVPVPPLHEQRRIVAEVEQCLSLIGAMQDAIESAGRRSATLRISILERAFRGELTSHDPDDEPAFDLLVRIAGERTTVTPKRPAKVTT